MSETDRIRKAIIDALPAEREAIEERHRVIDEWCRANGKDRDSLSSEDMIAIRALPEWQNAGKAQPRQTPGV